MASGGLTANSMNIDSFRTVRSISDWRLCLGCGACAYVCPKAKIDLVDVLSEGIRPLVADERCNGCSDCLQVCPAYHNDHRPLLDQPGLIPDVLAAYGPALELWEGYAVDPEIRLMGSSGGVLTALGQYCIERAGMHGVLHIAGDPSDPVRNRTRLSRTRADLMAATGSRYAPASACDQLRLIESAPAPCAFVGQPSEATALRKVLRLRPELQAKVGVILSFFCAGSPSTRGTQQFLQAHGFAPEDVAEIRYRGRGWPGWFSVLRRHSAEPTPVKSYAESWGFLQAFRPLSVNLTPDGSGEDADISCGDPWYRPVQDGEAGRSMVVVRIAAGARPSARGTRGRLRPSGAHERAGRARFAGEPDPQARRGGGARVRNAVDGSARPVAPGFLIAPQLAGAEHRRESQVDDWHCGPGCATWPVGVRGNWTQAEIVRRS